MVQLKSTKPKKKPKEEPKPVVVVEEKPKEEEKKKKFNDQNWMNRRSKKTHTFNADAVPSSP